MYRCVVCWQVHVEFLFGTQLFFFFNCVSLLFLFLLTSCILHKLLSSFCCNWHWRLPHTCSGYLVCKGDLCKSVNMPFFVWRHYGHHFQNFVWLNNSSLLFSCSCVLWFCEAWKRQKFCRDFFRNRCRSTDFKGQVYTINAFKLLIIFPRLVSLMSLDSV